MPDFDLFLYIDLHNLNNIGLLSDYLNSMNKFLENESEKLRVHISTLDQNQKNQLNSEAAKIKRELESKLGRSIDYKNPLFKNRFQPVYENWIIEKSQGELRGLEYEHQTIEEFTEILRRSFFVALIAYLEAYFKKVSQLVAERVNGQDKAFDRGYLKDAKIFFESIPGLDFNFGDVNHWTEIYEYYRVIRNAITHNGGVIEAKYKKVIKYISQNDNLGMVAGEVYLLDGFCEDAINVVNNFIESFQNAIYELLDQQSS